MSEHLELETYNTRGSGIWFRGQAGENIAAHDVVYVAVDGLLYRANAGAVGTMPAMGLAIYAVVQGLYGEFLSKGFIGDTAWTWTAGDILYVAGVAGQMTAVGPAIEQQVAIALTATQIYFDPAGIDTAGGVGAGGRTDFTYLVERDNGTYTVYDNQGNVVSGPGASAAVQINWALTNGGAGCFIALEPDTTFAINDPILFTANGQTLQGGGFGSFIDGDALATTEHGIVISGYTDCIIRDLSIQTEDGGGKTCHCIYIEDNANRFHIENVTIVDSDSDGIRITGADILDGWILNCKILDTDDYGILTSMDIANYMRRLHIKDNVILSSGVNGILAIDLVDCEIHGNEVTGALGDGIELNLCTDCSVNDNHPHGNYGHGIFLVDCDNNIIEGNECHDNDVTDTSTYDGISIDSDSTDNIVVGNVCYGNHRYGMSIRGMRTDVVGNNVMFNDLTGIYVFGAESNISGNYCYDDSQESAGTYSEITIDSSADRLSIEGNYCNSPGDSSEHGIHLGEGASDISIVGNYCYNGMGSGICLDADNDDCHIVGNYCTLNDDYGIEIMNTSCNHNIVKENYLTGNVTGCILDGGTDTAVHYTFCRVTDPTVALGNHPAGLLEDATDTFIYDQFYAPLEFQELVTADVVVVSAAAGNLRWNAFTDYGKICAGEAYNVHTDSVGATTTTLVQYDFECLDMTAALDVAALAAGDLVGVRFLRDGDDGLDTIDDEVFYLGIRVRYV